MRFAPTWLTCLVTLLATTSCDSDRVTPAELQKDGGVSTYRDLEGKDDVPYNLELAYNERNLDQFAKLLADDFVFVFSKADYNNGVVEFPEWSRVAEVDATGRMFDRNLDAPKRVLSIYLKINDNGGEWTPDPPGEAHPDETWYIKVIDYDLVIKTADHWEHRALDLKARFTIRQDPDSARWQVVLWRDDVDAKVALSPGGAAVEETTWGAIKALYDM